MEVMLITQSMFRPVLIQVLKDTRSSISTIIWSLNLQISSILCQVDVLFQLTRYILMLLEIVKEFLEYLSLLMLKQKVLQFLQFQV